MRDARSAGSAKDNPAHARIKSLCADPVSAASLLACSAALAGAWPRRWVTVVISRAWWRGSAYQDFMARSSASRAGA